MENGFASPRADAFPAGLRVLVVDDDLTWLKILEKMLKKCSYEVTTCGLAREALNMLREKKDRFDIVISDVNMPDMDGFKLLEHVGLEMDLPVIIMSVDGETSRVMKGVQHGACDYLLKPVRMKELRNIWQHVFRKKIHEVKEIESYEGFDDTRIMRNGSEEFADGPIHSGGDVSSSKKRKDMDNKDNEEQELNDPSAVKKARVVWSVDLHQKFVNAVNQIGFDKVGPKKILDLMNVPWLTRENVASHLQKYRLYLSRLQKQNEPKASFAGTKQSDSSSKDTRGSFGLQSSVTMHHKSVANGNYGYCGNEIYLQDVGPETRDGDLKGIISFLPTTEPKQAFTCDAYVPPKANNGSCLSLAHSCGSLESDTNYASFDSPIQPQTSWSGEIPGMQFVQQPKQEQDTYLMLDDYIHPPLPGPQHNHLQPTSSVNHRTAIMDRDKVTPTEIKSLHIGYRSNHVKNVSPTGHTAEPVSFPSEADIVNTQAFGSTPSPSGSSEVKNQGFDASCISSSEPLQQIIVSGSGSFPSSLHKDLDLSSLQGYGAPENVDFNNVGFFDYDDPAFSTNLPLHFFDGLRSSCDYLYESMEYPVMDQSLFIA
ncbi:two-component response regulator ORR26-like [Macadamia integrifolia]|uniref:two-component response regulator ORR26-like n=1 Tax=Macadamia integrifolia TaxID=60698 RepID=UPI001C4F78B2|nr:two-component response regulator ORR26-like [Macadamia integrifolia]